MVSSHMPDALYAPTQVIQSLWKTLLETSAQQDILKLIDEFPGVVDAHFRNAVNLGSGLKEIRSPRTYRALESTQDRTLVRMRLMVQDNSISPEIYLAQQPNETPGGWAVEHPQSPVAEGNECHPMFSSGEVDYAKLRERHVFWAVQVPGESSWPSQLLDGDTGRCAEATTDEEPPFCAYKSPNGELGLQLKIYGKAPKLSPTDVGTFVGILDHEPYAGNQSHDSPLIPTLHVVYWQPNPVTLLQESEFPPLDPDSSRADWLTLIDSIAEALGGDLDAAKLVALCVTSGGRDSKSPTNSPISITLAGFPAAPSPSSIPTIAAILEQLLPLVSHIPLSLDVLNTTSMAPYSEPSREDLSAGRLQLPAGSLVIFDERVEEGKLIEKGVENVRTIQDVLLRQTLSYRFPYSSFDFKTNINSVVVTEGKREALFVKTDLCIPVRPRANSNLYASPPTHDKLYALRRLMFRIKTGNQTGLKAAPTLSEHVQEMFVRERQTERASGGRKDDISAADEYGVRMRLSKTMSLALGLNEITCEVFDEVVDLDKRRIQRLKEIPLGSGPV